MKLRRTWWFLRRQRGRSCCGCVCWPWEPARPSRRPFPAFSVSISRLPPQNRGSCAGSQPWPPEWQSESHLRREKGIDRERERDDACGRQQQLVRLTQRVLTTNTCCEVAIMVPRDGALLKTTDTTHDAGPGEGREPMNESEEKREAGPDKRRQREEAKPRQSLANQALLPGFVLLLPARPPARPNPAPNSAQVLHPPFHVISTFSFFKPTWMGPCQTTQGYHTRGGEVNPKL